MEKGTLDLFTHICTCNGYNHSTADELHPDTITLDPTFSRPSTLIQITTVTRTFNDQYENGITYPRTLPRPHPCPHSEEGWSTCKPTQPVFIHIHALLHYYSHSSTLHTPHHVHNLQLIEVRAVSMMTMKSPMSYTGADNLPQTSVVFLTEQTIFESEEALPALTVVISCIVCHTCLPPLTTDKVVYISMCIA